MKTYLLFLSIGLLTIIGCKKDDNNSNANKLTASFDGTSRSFNNSLVASTTSSGGVYALQVVGFEGAAGTSDVLYLTIYDSSPIVAGIYTDGQTAGISYVSQTGGVVNYSNALSATNPISITITSISSTNVSGTFKGDIFEGSNTSSTKKVLTNGQFNAKF